MDLQCAKVKNPCKFCLQNVTNKNGLQCMGACGKWAHFKCLSYTPGKISDIKAGIIKVTCPCPDCNTSQPKEFLKKPPISCSNHECPAHKVPKCESKECPVNRKNVVTFPTPPSPQYKDACSPASCSPKSPSSPASPNSQEYPPRNPPTCFIPRTPPTPPTPQTPPTPPSCPPSPPCCAAIPRCSPCPPCCPGTPSPCPPSPPISPCPPPPPKCPPPPPKCPPPPPKCPPPPPKCPPPPPKCPPPPPKCPPPPPKCPPDNYPPPKCPPKCPSTPRCCSPPCNYPPCSKPPRCPPPRCPPKQKPACPATPPHLVQNYSATQRPNYSAPQQQTASYVDVGTPMKSPSCSVISYNVPDVSSSFEKTSSVVLMANKSDYFMSAHEEDIPEEKAALQATSATQIPAELVNSPSFGHRCSQTFISTSATQISYDPEESMVSTMQKMNYAIDQLSLKIQIFMKRVEMRQR